MPVNSVILFSESMKFKNLIKVLFVFLHVLCNLHAQDTAFYLSAKIIDGIRQTPVENVHIKICGSYRSVFTNRYGQFTIPVKKSGEVLEVQAAGYAPVFISTPLVMRPEMAFPLDPIGFPNQKNKSATATVFRNGKWKVNEFAFFKAGMVLLCTDLSSGRDAVLLVSRENKFICARPVSDRLTGFAETSSGDHAVLGEEKAYFFNIENEKISVAEDEITNFERKYYSSPFRDSSGKYIRYQSGYEFFLSPDLSLMVRRTYLTYHVRMKKNNRLSLFKNFNDDKFSKSPGRWKKAEEIISNSEAPHCLTNIYFHETPWQVIQDRDKLLFIDLENSKAEIYDSIGKLTKTVAYFTGGPKETIQQKFIYDQVSRKVYYCAVVSSGNKEEKVFVTSIMEIDFNTGSRTLKTEMEPEVFTTVKIDDGKLFYIKEDHGLSYLVKIKLE